MLVVRLQICYHRGRKSEDESGVTCHFPQTHLKQRGLAWSVSNTLSIAGMHGEVRAHCVSCHFPSCPIPSRYVPSCALLSVTEKGTRS